MWGGGKFNAATISLEPLSDQDCTDLIAHLLGRAELPDAARTRILEHAEGTPLFVEEMLGMLIDDGHLVRDVDGWVAGSDLSAISVPPTIQALLAARVDRLPPEERAVLGRAAVEGKEFRRDAVVELEGVPVFYTPFFSHADPTVRHESGLLTPDLGSKRTLGYFVRLPYYIAFNDSQDATIEGMALMACSAAWRSTAKFAFPPSQ